MTRSAPGLRRPQPRSARAAVALAVTALVAAGGLAVAPTADADPGHSSGRSSSSRSHRAGVQPPAHSSAAAPKANAAAVARAQAAVTASAQATRAAAPVLPSLRRFEWTTPVTGTYKSSGFGERWGRLHAGLDFAGPEGLGLRSICSGTVSFAGQAGGYGNKFEVMCWDGTLVRYGHMRHIAAKVGQQVQPGTYVGRLGTTGHSTGPHLHIEIHPGGGPAIDPAPWLAARGITPADVKTPPAAQAAPTKTAATKG